MALQTPRTRPTARGLTLLAVIALLACASPGEFRESRRDARVGARLALASVGVIVGLLSTAPHSEAASATASAVDAPARAIARLTRLPEAAGLRPDALARRGELDLPPPTA